MAAQLGRGLLIKAGDGASPEVFTAVAGLRSKSIALNNESVDITNSDSASQWRELLSAAGIKSANISGSGVFKDDAQDEVIRGYFWAGTVNNFQILVPDFGTITGAFLITALEYTGEHATEVPFSMTLESAGVITFASV